MNNSVDAARAQQAAPANGVSIRSILFSRRGPTNQANDNNVRRRPRQIFRINYWSILAEWTSSAIALSLLCFYSYSLLTASGDDADSLSFKLLASNVILSVYMRICYILHSASKTFVLIKEGPVDTSVLPFQSQINSFSCLMGFVEPGHFVCLCWITHISFPFKPCEDLEPQSPVCTSLHITSTIFVSMWVFTGAAFIVLLACFARWERNGGRNTGLSDTLRMSPIPDNIRESIINSLPVTDDAPDDGEVCAICCDRDIGETPTRWRVLPCGHKFHPSCVDEWLKKQGSTCPTCRHDPVLGNPRAGPATVEEMLHTGPGQAAAQPAVPTESRRAGTGPQVGSGGGADLEAGLGPTHPAQVGGDESHIGRSPQAAVVLLNVPGDGWAASRASPASAGPQNPNAQPNFVQQRQATVAAATSPLRVTSGAPLLGVT